LRAIALQRAGVKNAKEPDGKNYKLGTSKPGKNAKKTWTAVKL
jgi:hypothetical protein